MKYKIVIFVFLFIGVSLSQASLFGKQIERVYAKEKVKPEYLPPYLNLDLTVNISSAAVSNVYLITNGDIKVSGLNDKLTVRSFIKSFGKVNDDGQYSVRMKLSGRHGTARISLTENSSAVIMTQALYPAQINETDRSEKGKISYETFNAPSAPKTKDQYFKEKGYKESIGNKLKTRITYFDKTSQNEKVYGVKVGVSQDVEDRAKSLYFKDFVVSRNVRETAVRWILEALGLDPTNKTQVGYLKSMIATSTPEIENVIPYEITSQNGILEDLTSGVAGVASVVTGAVHGAGEFIHDTTGISTVEDMTTGINDAVKKAEECAKQNFINVLCPEAVNTAIDPIVKPVQDVFEQIPGVKIVTNLAGGSLGFINGLLTNPGGFIKKIVIGFLVIFLTIFFIIPILRSYLSGRARRAGGEKK